MIGTVEIGSDGLTAIYLVSAACFVLALKALSSPKNARYGNLVGVAGMIVAIALTFLAPSLAEHPGHDWVIGAGMALGALVAVPTARKVPMTGIPQMVAIFNGVGGGAAAVISLDEYLYELPKVPAQKGVEIMFALVVGCVSFAGSTLAFAKLQELMTGRPVQYPGQQVVNAVDRAGGGGPRGRHRRGPAPIAHPGAGGCGSRLGRRGCAAGRGSRHAGAHLLAQQLYGHGRGG